MNNNSMPQMPSMNKSSDESGINPDLSSSFADDSPSGGSDVKNDDKPKLVTSEDNNSSNVASPSAPKKGIEVVALGSGFYNQSRKIIGDKFFIKSFDQIGEWMECVDSAWEKKRKEFYKNKKAKK